MIDIRFLHEQLAHDLTPVLDKGIAILGCGAIGANLAISLARRGFCKFYLIDDSRIEEHNISTQPWSTPDLSRMKVAPLARQLLWISEAYTNTYYKRVTKSQQLTSFLPASTAVIVDSFDNSASRKIAQDLSRHWPVLHVGMSAENTAEVTWDENYTVPPDVELADPCAYSLSRSLVELTVIAAAEALMQLLISGKKTDYLIRGKELCIQKMP